MMMMMMMWKPLAQVSICPSPAPLLPHRCVVRELVFDVFISIFQKKPLISILTRLSNVARREMKSTAQAAHVHMHVMCVVPSSAVKLVGWLVSSEVVKWMRQEPSWYYPESFLLSDQLRFLRIYSNITSSREWNSFPTGHHETSLNVNVVQCFVILRSMEGFLLIQVLAMYQTSV